MRLVGDDYIVLTQRPELRDRSGLEERSGAPRLYPGQ